MWKYNSFWASFGLFNYSLVKLYYIIAFHPRESKWNKRILLFLVDSIFLVGQTVGSVEVVVAFINNHNTVPFVAKINYLCILFVFCTNWKVKFEIFLIGLLLMFYHLHYNLH